MSGAVQTNEMIEEENDQMMDQMAHKVAALRTVSLSTTIGIPDPPLPNVVVHTVFRKDISHQRRVSEGVICSSAQSLPTCSSPREHPWKGALWWGPIQLAVVRENILGRGHFWWGPIQLAIVPRNTPWKGALLVGTHPTCNSPREHP